MDIILGKIKRIRESKNLSQEYMADKLGFDQSSYAKIESGRTKLTIEKLNLIAEALAVPVKALWDENQFEDPNYKAPDELLSAMEPAKQEAVRKEVDLYKELLKAKEDLIEQLRENVNLLSEQLAEYKTKKKNA